MFLVIGLESETSGLFLQFLSMKLATINPRMEFNANAALSSEVTISAFEDVHIENVVFCITNVCICLCVYR